MEFVYVIAGIIISLGTFFLLVGSIGLVRLPDFFSRTHATGKSDTLGIMLILFGLILTQGFSINSAKLLIILTFVGLTNPTATNALAKAAFHAPYVLRILGLEKEESGKEGKEEGKKDESQKEKVKK